MNNFNLIKIDDENTTTTTTSVPNRYHQIGMLDNKNDYQSIIISDNNNNSSLLAETILNQFTTTSADFPFNDYLSTTTTTATTIDAQQTNQTIGTTIILEPDLRVHYPGLSILLGIICVIVVFGNGLTMLSICKERYLRTVTNYFVASLAFADCLVGAIVMPFSVVHEVMNKWWIFGQDWCDLWHSFDVLASTASILNLCIISLDRYWAITDPITYPSRMTPRKAFIFILSLWLCSALISFPAIVWWRAVAKKPIEPYRCNFTEDVGYLVFSSIISFYGPLTIMVFTYYRIYVVASEQNRSLKLGVKQIEMSYIGHMNADNIGLSSQQANLLHSNSGSTNNISSNINNNADYYRSNFTLRIHRGGGAAAAAAAAAGSVATATSPTTNTTLSILKKKKNSSKSTTKNNNNNKTIGKKL
ncbi:receptor [Dermatophagoides farinae]|uniref:Receptor n=1 Tax=Dermatophagoides farinae TaxID=6954 RepID=A0A922IEK6_DERFA|nr:receptor [Dermatophagoides farinae]